MKLTTQQIKEIINEELENLQNEGFFSYMKDLAGQVGHSVGKTLRGGPKMTDDAVMKYIVNDWPGGEIKNDPGAASEYHLKSLIKSYGKGFSDAKVDELFNKMEATDIIRQSPKGNWLISFNGRFYKDN